MKRTLTWTWGDIVIAKNKSFEYQFDFGKKANFYPFELSFLITSKKDHAGISFTFCIMNIIHVCLRTYDHRHWNYEKDCWEGE